MKHNNKQALLNVIADALSFCVNMGISLTVIPFVVERIGTEAYGFVGLANSFVNYASIITAALNSMASRFITVSMQKGDKEETQSYISSVFAANIILAVPMAVVMGIIIANLEHIVDISSTLLPDVRILWAFIFANFVFSLVASVYSIATFTKNRLELASIRKIVGSIIKAGILLVTFCFLAPRVWYIGLSVFVAGTYLSLSNVRLSHRLMPEVKYQRSLVSLKKIGTLIASGVWNSISQLCSVMLEELDLLITNLFVSAACMGIVSIAKKLPVQILSFFTVFSRSFGPQITINYSKGDYEEVRQNVLTAMRWISFCCCIPMACIYAFGREFFSLWVPGQDSDLLQLIAILACLEFPLALPLNPIWKLFTAANKTRQTAISSIVIASLSVAVTFTLLQLVQSDLAKMCVIVGVSSCIDIVYDFTFLPMYGAHCLNMSKWTFYPMLLKNIFSIALLTLVAFGIKYVINIDSWLMLIVDGCLTCVVSFIINWFLLLSAGDRKAFIAKIKKFCEKIRN